MKMLLLIACLFFTAPAMAQQASLKIELAENHVDISTGFNGTRVILFGTTSDPDADVIVTLKGSENTMAMRRKGRVMGAWVNVKSVEFRRVPSYYDYASTLSDSALTGDHAYLKDHEIGLQNLEFYPEDADEDAEVIASFRDALIGNMQKRGFYPLAGHTLQRLDPQFFKAVFVLPPGVPTGLYRVEAILVKDNAVIAKEVKNLQVGQVGFNARVYLFAQNFSLFYGVFAVVMALAIGGSAFTFLRRD